MLHLLAKYLEMRPLFLCLALPMKEEWKINPYLGVLPLVFRALNRAFSAPRICTVDAGYLASSSRPVTSNREYPEAASNRMNSVDIANPLLRAHKPNPTLQSNDLTGTLYATEAQHRDRQVWD
ncbi:MAG: hypothetical protein FRX49_11348 [Trebouxia sp. A1-2]|nr:MAG: hypothetical protein FRX49_11348 [Trebouxia sp. A1-2]